MTKKLYNIILDDKTIGTTELEKADAPMGVVVGQIKFIDITSGYDFFKTYCLTNDIEIITDDPDDRLLITADIPTIRVTNPSGIEIKGLGTNIEGMDSDIFAVTILGVPYPFFGEEFPHHVRAYMKYETITFDDARREICQILGYEPEYLFELTPNEILCVIEETGIILEDKQIPGWADFEQGKREMLPEELFSQTNIPLNSDSKTIIITDECFKDRRAYVVASCDLLDFADNVYPTLHEMDFVQSSDLLLINPEKKVVSMIHHEGALLEYK